MELYRDRLIILHGKHSPEILAKDQIARIEVRQAGRFAHKIRVNLKIPAAALIAGLGLCRFDGSCVAGVMAATSFFWAAPFAVSAFYLIADVICLLIPPKVYEVVP